MPDAQSSSSSEGAVTVKSEPDTQNVTRVESTGSGEGLKRRWKPSLKAVIHGKSKEEHQEEPEADNSEEESVKIVQPKLRYLPIISGLICPFSVLLDIPGLTERWYVRTDGNMVVESRPNPVILDVGQAVSMALGVAANIGLILRFLERHPYVSTWVAMVSLTLHDVINVVICLTFGIVHRIDDGFTYGDAFWLTVAATVASLICNVTLVVDYVRTKDFKNSGSGLSEKQRSLIIAAMSLLCYIALGALVFSFLIGDLTFIDSLYFTICTVTSVGFGDIVPVSARARIFTMVYAIFGLVLLGFTIAIGRETIIETFEQSYRARRDALAQKARERKEEKRKRLRERRQQRERELREHLERDGVEDAQAQAQNVVEQEMQQPLEAVGIQIDETVTGELHRHRGRRLPLRRGQSLSPGTQEAARAVGTAQRELDYEMERADGMSYFSARLRRVLRWMGLMKSYVPSLHDGESQHEEEERNVGLQRSNTTSSSASQEEKFQSFRKQLQHEQSREFHVKLTIVLSLFLVFWLAGAGVFTLTEQSWSYFDSLWFVYVTFTTIGYGDFSPKSAGGRAFFIAWSLWGISIMTLTISVLTESYSSRFKSTIVDSNSRRLRRRSGEKARESRLQKLLASEGFQEDDEVEAKDLPAKLLQTVKGFHSHARYFMLGPSGDPPERYKNLIDAAAELDEELGRAVSENSLGGAADDAKHFLFMISYERQFDALTEAAEQLTSTFERHQQELGEMQKLNAQLRSALLERETPQRPSEGSSRRGPSTGPQPLIPFAKRPPGGYGDEEREEELEEELENNSDTEDDGGENESEGERANKTAERHVTSATAAAPPLSSACATLDQSTAMLQRMEDSPPLEKVALHPSPAGTQAFPGFTARSASNISSQPPTDSSPNSPARSCSGSGSSAKAGSSV